MTTQKITPLMKQYFQIKSLHKDKILLFRMGDFFEMFHQDAQIAAPILNITLTVRNKKSANETKMCGMPYHSISRPISKLLAAGFKVAICDQMEPASQAKGLVRRAVTRVLTPGMVYDPESLDQLTAHYICAFDDASISFTDTSTGEAFFYLNSDSHTQLRLISILNPVELILTPKQKQDCFSQKKWEDFHISVFELECTPKSSLPVSACRILAYIKFQQGEQAVKIIQNFRQKTIDQELCCSYQAQSHLELFKTYEGDAKGSLFFVINRTKTPAGARLLKSRLRHASTNKIELESKLDAVEKWFSQPEKITPVRKLLSQVGDFERRLGKISHPQCHGRDFLSLADSLHSSLEIIPYDTSCFISSLVLGSIGELTNEIIRTIRVDTPLGTQAANMIQKGVCEKLDQLIKESETIQLQLRNLEIAERQKTGISTLKIRYNNVFGYYIEISKLHSHKVPSHYLRKQTLTQAERYTIESLQEIETKVLTSRKKRIDMEFSIFENLRQKILGSVTDLFYLSRIICDIDVHVAFAYLAIEQSYVRPQFSSDNQLVLVNSRHPVVEQNSGSHFIPNTIRMNRGECLLLTGPNMAGKSTLMRQVALSVILAQAGSFVPAEKALLPIFTKLFTRIGASDSLSKGLSTFMVEMKEVVEILHKADEDSLIILDEIGRGTATYDGMSIAQSILEYLVQNKKSIIFFATHYHELTELENMFSNIKNAHLSVRESNNKIYFLYTLVSGSLDQSYGIYVARLAGFPSEVLKRAENLLQKRVAHYNSKSAQQHTDLFSVCAATQTSTTLNNKPSK